MPFKPIGLQQKKNVPSDKMKEDKGVKLDTELTAEDLKELVVKFKAFYKENKGEDFPTEPRVQLLEAVKAVFRSWDNDRAIVYRRMNDIPGDWGTAVNVQAMVFGSLIAAFYSIAAGGDSEKQN